jgi:5-methylcytosine-specific restriction endonuclease McrA
MIAEPMHFSLSLDLVSWRANLWADHERCPNEKPVLDDDQFTLRKPCDEAIVEEPVNPAQDEQARFVRQPVRVVYAPRGSRNG